VSEDRLSLRGVVCRCRIGVTDEERREPQEIEVDVDLILDLTEAGRAGAIERTLDYREVCQAVRGLLEGTAFRLIEAAASGTLDLLLERYTVRRAVVRVRKFILPNVRHVEVQMERARARGSAPGGIDGG